MKLLPRYLLREHLPPFVFALAALTGLMLLNQVARQFGNLVGKGLPWSVIGEFFALSVPFIVAMTLPMAVLVAALYAFVRLGADNEITALRASGVNLVSLVRPVLLAGVVLSLISFVFVDQVLPPANHKLATLMMDIARKKPTFELKEQMVNEVIPQQYFLRAGRIDQATDRLKDVVIYDLTNDQRRRTIYADSGYMAFSNDRTVLLLTLFDGYVHDIDRSQPGVFRRVFFRTDLVKVHGVSNRFERSEGDYGKGDREMSVCEMNTRLRPLLITLASVRQSRGTVLSRDIRTLLGVQRWPADTAAPRPDHYLWVASFYCKALGGVGRLFLPRAARAQAPGSPEALRRAAQAAVAAASPARPAPAFRVIADTTGSQLRAQLASLETQRTQVLQQAARYEIEMHKKFAIAAACIVFVLIGAPVALRFPRGGVGLVIGASVLIFGFYYVGLIGGETLANDLIISPFWAMWGANFVMTAIGLWLLALLNRQRVAARATWRERLRLLAERWRPRRKRART